MCNSNFFSYVDGVREMVFMAMDEHGIKCDDGHWMTEEELFALAGNGIYVTELKSFSATNTVTGDFSIESAGFLIENGKLGKFVKSFTIAGNFFELLKNIEALSNDLQVKSSGIFRGFAAPDALIKNLSVAGK